MPQGVWRIVRPDRLLISRLLPFHPSSPCLRDLLLSHIPIEKPRNEKYRGEGGEASPRFGA